MRLPPDPVKRFIIGGAFVVGLTLSVVPAQVLAAYGDGQTVGAGGQAVGLQTQWVVSQSEPFGLAQGEAVWERVSGWFSQAFQSTFSSQKGTAVAGKKPEVKLAKKTTPLAARVGQVLGEATESAGSVFSGFWGWLTGLFASSEAPIASEPQPSALPKASKVIKPVIADEPEAEVSSGELTAGDGIAISLADIISVVASALAGNGLTSSSNNLDVDVGTTANKIVQLDVNGLYPAASGKKITDMDAANLKYGIIGTDRLDGQYGKIQGVGTLTEGTWNANIIADAYINNNLTLGTVSGDPTFTGTVTFSGSSSTTTYNDDVKLSLGTGGPVDLLWETADANANELIVAFDEGGATDVPVMVVGDASIDNVDLGMFNGVTDPSIAVVSDDAGDYGRMFVTDAGVFTLRSGTGDIALQPDADTGDYFTFSSDGTNLTLGTTDAAGLTVTNNAGLAAATVIVSTAGGIDISTGSGAAGNDIDILSGSSINLTAAESAVDAIVLTSSAGGIDILASGAAAGEDIDILATGSSVNLQSTEGVANAITLVSTAGGIDISTGSQTQDIDILGGASINLTAAESAADSIVLTSSAGGIDILATGAAAGEDIDIVSTGSSVNLSSTEGVENAITLVSSAGGINISTGSGAAANDIDLLSGSSINLTAAESAVDAIVLTSSAGGIDILASGAAAGEDIDILATGSSVNLQSTEGVANAITLVSTAGGIDISTGSQTQDIDILGGASINLTAAESAADSIVLTSSAGGIDILASGAAAGEDIDITATGSSVNLSSTEGVENAITLVSSAGGINISTGSGAAANDIDILGGSSVNLKAYESAADAMTLITYGAAGGIDLSTGGQLGQGGSIDILSGQAAASAITIVAPQGGIDISTGSETADIDILGGDNINITSADNTSTAVNIQATAGGLSVSGGTDTVNSSGMVITSANVNLYGDVLIDMTATATTNGVCHSGAASDTVAYNRTLVACSGAPADVAEWYETKPGVGAGDVVVLSGETIEYAYTPFDPFTGMQVEGATKTEKVSVLKVSEGTYNPYLIGVVSTSPYQVFGSAIKDVAKNPQPIALSGRVPVKVTNENGPIAVGDYLTSSSTPGYAMRASKGGMVVGTALEAFEGSSGQVMIFVGRGYVADGVYEQMALLSALGASSEGLDTGAILGVSSLETLAPDLAAATAAVETVAVTAEAVSETAAGEVVAQSDGQVLAAGNEALPVVKTQVVDELTVTTAATFEGTLLVLGDATFQGSLTVNGIEVKGDVNLTGAVTVAMTAGGNVGAGDPVAVNGDGSVSRAGGGRPVVGVAASGASAGGTVRVAVAGRVGGLSGLSAGVRYFVDTSGALTTDPAGNQALGVALSGSELLVQPGLGWPAAAEVIPVESPSPSATPAPSETVSPAPEASASAESNAAGATSNVAEGSVAGVSTQVDLVVQNPSPTPLPTPSSGIISPLP